VFNRSAEFYDAIYAGRGKDYEDEVARLHDLILWHKESRGSKLLDVACGTGGHIAYLKKHYDVEGLDENDGMLREARRRHPDVVFHKGGMPKFRLDSSFDVVVCLFSSIGYVKTLDRLMEAVKTMAEHLREGGVLTVEPWLMREDFHEGTVHASFVDRPDLKIARMNVSEIEDGVFVLDFHYLVGTPNGVEYFRERHKLGLFSDNEYRRAFREAGLQIAYDAEGLTGRGLYVGTR
jgi:ubiquinone/menaquinone biosynthesis C-methylase UbiE